MFDIVARLVTQSWLVLGQMAPYLLFGFLMAGVLSVCISPAWVERHLGRRGIGPVLAASLFGVPLPLCSCSVIPVSASIRRHGASRAATTAFLLSTPQTGVDSIAVTYALLGLPFAIVRPLVALLTGVVGGVLVWLFAEHDGLTEVANRTAGTCSEPCCQGRGQRSIVSRALGYGLLTLPRDIGPALLVGVLIAGAMATFVEQNQLHAYVGGGILSILLLMAAGVPVYVCATASVPIAAGFIRMGVSPGAALAFLIAGPATNAATLTTIWKVLGRRTMVLYLATIAGSAIVAGLLLDWLFRVMHWAPPLMGAQVHAGGHGGWLPHLWAVALVAVVALSFILSTRRHEEHGAAEERAAGDASGEQRLEMRVSGLRCSHCADSVGRALGECDGVRWAEVSLKSGRALVLGHDLDPQQLASAVADLGYTAEPLGDVQPDEGAG
jgi:uncharacterized membrane protein YraQ (UPF0718 family)/copper chaperone CopZ